MAKKRLTVIKKPKRPPPETVAKDVPILPEEWPGWNKADSPKPAGVTRPTQSSEFEGRLTLRQKRFALEFIKDYNATNATLRVGATSLNGKDPSTVPFGGFANLNSAATAGSKMLDNRDVRAYIRKLQRIELRDFFVSADRIKKEISRVAFSNILDYVKPGRGGYSLTYADFEKVDGACIQELTPTSEGVKIKLYPKIDALTKLAQIHGLFEKDNAQRRPVINIGETGDSAVTGGTVEDEDEDD